MSSVWFPQYITNVSLHNKHHLYSYSHRLSFQWGSDRSFKCVMLQNHEPDSLHKVCESYNACPVPQYGGSFTNSPDLYSNGANTGWTQKHYLMYMEMLTNWLIPQLAAERHDYLLQQDGAPLHWHLAVRTFLSEHLPNRWFGRTGQNDQIFCNWPPRSPDLTVCDFFL